MIILVRLDLTFEQLVTAVETLSGVTDKKNITKKRVMKWLKTLIAEKGVAAIAKEPSQRKKIERDDAAAFVRKTWPEAKEPIFKDAEQ